MIRKQKMSYIMGIHCSFNANIHDPSASLIADGKIVCHIEEERLNRNKTSVGHFPELAIRRTLKECKISFEDLDCICVDGHEWSKIGEIKVRRYIEAIYGFCPRLEFYDHEECHVAGAFYASPYKRALCISLDGYGEGKSGLIALASRDEGIKLLREFKMPDSMGLFYTCFTNFLGFKSVEDEFKVMGMAAFGVDKYDLSDELLYENGGYHCTNSLVDDSNYLSSIWEPKVKYDYIERKYGVKRRLRGSEFTQENFDLAASVQAQFTKVYSELIRYWKEQTGENYLVMSGGCAMNCMANQLIQEMDFDDHYVFPLSSDRGLSIGAASLGCAKRNIEISSMDNIYIGTTYHEEDVLQAVRNSGLETEVYDEKELYYARVAQLLVEGSVVGWIEGRSEIGPRALGARSILGLATVAGIKDKINKKIKFREEYRPFAPAIRKVDAEYVLGKISRITSLRYMTENVKIPEGVEIFGEAMNRDRTSRIQVVLTDDPLHALMDQISCSIERPVLINTSFNLAGEPIVDSPIDGLRTFISSGLDVYASYPCVVVKKVYGNQKNVGGAQCTVN